MMDDRLLQVQRMTAAVLAFCAAIACGAPSSFGEDEIAFGPYVQNVTHRTATICWSTVAGSSSFERLGGDGEVHRQYEQHFMMLNDLKPGTRYRYDVLGNGSAEGKGAFTTFPKKAGPFRFVALGDTRTRHDVHQQIVSRVQQENPLFVINTGDLVSDGLEIPHWEAFFRVSRELMRGVPYYPALGNHERNARYYFDFFALPGNERYYTFTVGGALIMVLDSQGEAFSIPEYVKRSNRAEFWTEHNRAYMEEQKAWAEQRLTLHRDADFIFVAFHVPMYSANQGRQAQAASQRAFWGDLFERHGVQVVFNGHDHHYHHALHGGTHYVVTGGGGAPLYIANAPQPETVKTAKTEHFVRVDVKEDEAVLTVIDVNGDTLDEFSVPKRK